MAEDYVRVARTFTWVYDVPLSRFPGFSEDQIKYIVTRDLPDAILPQYEMGGTLPSRQVATCGIIKKESANGEDAGKEREPEPSGTGVQPQRAEGEAHEGEARPEAGVGEATQ